METLSHKLTSRKLLVALAAMAYAVVQVFLGELAAADGVKAVAALAVAYLTAEAAADVTH